MAVFWYGGAFLVVPLVTSASSVDRYLVYLDGEPFVPLLLASYWCLVLKLQLGSVTHSPLLALHLEWTFPWKSVSCLKLMKVHFAGCLRLICIAVVGLGAPLSRFLEGAPYKFLNELNECFSELVLPSLDVALRYFVPSLMLPFI